RSSQIRSVRGFFDYISIGGKPFPQHRNLFVPIKMAKEEKKEKREPLPGFPYPSIDFLFSD
ncbi:MAG TPA: hypothetical protein PKW59_13025, partial [Thermotogota bacterium]|nr:hypothetical protein [Thermotogota bacterium]